MTKRQGDWMFTFSGVKFWPLDPRPEEILFADIAHGLSNVCRFGGHAKKFYSVAEHCVRVAHLLVAWKEPKEIAAWGLVHDAAEAYLGDVIRPLKTFFPAYKVVEEKVLRAIAKKLDLPWPEPARVKDADKAVLSREIVDVMHEGCKDQVELRHDPKTEVVVPRNQAAAKFMWELEFKRFFGKSIEEADRG